MSALNTASAERADALVARLKAKGTMNDRWEPLSTLLLVDEFLRAHVEEFGPHLDYPENPSRMDRDLMAMCDLVGFASMDEVWLAEKGHPYEEEPSGLQKVRDAVEKAGGTTQNPEGFA
jgi:hypothetical protein